MAKAEKKKKKPATKANAKKEATKKERPAKRVTGIGGIFFKSEGPGKMREWYQSHLGIAADEYGTTFGWRHESDTSRRGITTWCIFPHTSNYFDPSKQSFMINYRVNNLKQLLEELRKEGVQVVGEMQEFEYGKFGWIVDPDGNKIELWQPVDEIIK
jgi:predicted enzyme related to lactoylglutathione lyase